jgi:hypothetical protein
MWTIENRARYKRDHLRYPSDVTDEEWAHVELLIPPAKRGGRKREANMREVGTTVTASSPWYSRRSTVPGVANKNSPRGL